MAPMPVESRAKNLPAQPLNRRGKAGQKSVCTANPALTETEQVRFDMALIPITGEIHFLQDGMVLA